MNNDTINKSLIEVEKNLKNLTTARTQVNNISEKSEILVAEVSNLISKISDLQNEFNIEKSELNENLTESIINFQSSLQQGSDMFIGKSKEILNSHSSSMVNNISVLEEFQRKIIVAEENLANLDFEKGLSALSLGQKDVLEHQNNLKLDIENLFKHLNTTLNAIKVDLIKELKISHDKLSIDVIESFIDLKNQQQKSSEIFLKNLNSQSKKIAQVRNILITGIVIIVIIMMVQIFK